MEDGMITIEEAIAEVQREECKFPYYIDGKMVHTPEEALATYRQILIDEENAARRIRQSWLNTPGGKLCLEVYQKFQEYRAYLQQNPNAAPEPHPGADFKEHDFFEEGLLAMREYERMVREHERQRAEKALENLRRANAAARCRHRHADGRRCGSPRVRGKKLCHWHLRMEEVKAAKLDLGAMEDPDSIQMAIMKLQRAVIDGTLDPKTTGQLAYTIQLAAWNVTRTKMAREAKEERAE